MYSTDFGYYSPLAFPLVPPRGDVFVEIAQQLHVGLSWNVLEHEIPGMNCNNTGDLLTFHLAQPRGQNVIES